MDGLRVAELAERAGIAPSTVRFYERAGLLSPAQRAPNGYRVFGESAGYLNDAAILLFVTDAAYAVAANAQNATPATQPSSRAAPEPADAPHTPQPRPKP